MVNIYKGTNPLSPTASKDGITGMLLQGIAVAAGGGVTGIALGVSVELRSVKDAELRGLTEAYDKTNGVLVHYHIKEFFRLNPNGTLWIMIVGQAISWGTMLSDSTYATKLLADASGTIRILGVVFNPLSTYTPVITSGIDAQVFDAIEESQILASAQFLNNTPLASIVIEGRGMTATSAATLDNLRNQNAGTVSVLIGADYTSAFRADITANYTNAAKVRQHAAVGTMLGLVSRSQVNHSPAWVERNDVQDTTLKVFLQVGFSNQASVPVDTSLYREKGYLFFYKDVDAPGTYLSDSATCTTANAQDANIELNRTMIKAVKGVRAAVFPSVSMPILFDGNKIRRSVIEGLANKGRKPLTTMQNADEISSFTLSIDPAQDVISTGEIAIYYEIVPTGTGRTIKGYINFINPNV